MLIKNIFGRFRRRNLQKLVGKEFFLMYASSRELEECTRRDVRAGVDKDVLFDEPRAIGYCFEVAEKREDGIHVGGISFPVRNARYETGSEISDEYGFSYCLKIVRVTKTNYSTQIEGMLAKCDSRTGQDLTPREKVYLTGGPLEKCQSFNLSAYVL